MSQWFDRFNMREQISLLALALALLLYLAYMLLWRPLDVQREDMLARNAATAVSLQRVDGMVSEILALRESEGGATRRRNLTTVVNQTTAAAGLAVSRLQPNSRGEIQVRLEGVEFGALAGWLYEVEYGQSLLVREVSMTQSGSAGRVDATVRLGQSE
ncbi:type II secretion system protein M [Parahaliea maris]|uniref:Type II secretion system protein M n=1 Tax=Parahaliea maris TaxID=2716870 RepID=A0A5C9A827_9GAMM|nr:type II secretion system protein GspM [Parahaliea maris]TXS96279.1 type II secretion system protein M [Parahaliea maris]